jgi:nucleotide-binding universal stress UspA family protein
MLRLPWTRIPEPPDPAGFSPRSILLASEGGKISPAAIEFAARMAKKGGAPVHVFSIARIWGSAFGLPHPGLMPTKREWQKQRDQVTEVIDQLKAQGVEISGQVVSSRNAARRIVAEANRRKDDAIVMAAEPGRHWLIADMLWSQEPYRVRRLSKVPVYLVT